MCYFLSTLFPFHHSNWNSNPLKGTGTCEFGQQWPTEPGKSSERLFFLVGLWLWKISFLQTHASAQCLAGHFDGPFPIFLSLMEVLASPSPIFKRLLGFHLCGSFGGVSPLRGRWTKIYLSISQKCPFPVHMHTCIPTKVPVLMAGEDSLCQSGWALPDEGHLHLASPLPVFMFSSPLLACSASLPYLLPLLLWD